MTTTTSEVDLHDGRRPAVGDGVVRRLGDATVLSSADVRTSLALADLVGGQRTEVVLALALAVRAVRLGHVFVDLADVAATVTPDDEQVDLDALELDWPEPGGWVDLVGASPLVAVGVDGPDDRPARLMGSCLYLDRYWRHERAIVADLSARLTTPAPVVDRACLADGLRRLFLPVAAATPTGPAGVVGPAGVAEPTGVAGTAADDVVEGDASPDPALDDHLQRIAAATAVLRRFSVVAGGPGTGKTTTVARIVALLHEQAEVVGAPRPRIALVAPTGKAAIRMEEAVHSEGATLDTTDAVRAALAATRSSTIHRMLGFQPGNRSRFRHHRANPLPHTVVIVDESSMVSLSLMAKLLDAVRPDARLVLVGDPRQLASVEAGAVLGDIVGPAQDGLRLGRAARAEIEAVTGVAVPSGPVDAPGPVELSGPAGSSGRSSALGVGDDRGPDGASDDPEGTGTSIGDSIVVLHRVHRYGGAIAELADAIDSGDPDAVVAVLRRSTDDLTWHETAPDLPASPDDLRAIRSAVLEAATSVVEAARRGDGQSALDALGSVQVLCAHRRGPWGASRWRFEIERWLRAAIPGYAVGPWYPGRPLLVTENDYTLGVFNGDTGVVIDGGGGQLRAVFDRRGEILDVRPTRLAAVDSLYAITIHKAQGSQFGSVVVVLPQPTSPVLTRELLYTAVTRARTHLTLVAAESSIRAAVTRPVARASGLADALWADAR